MSGNGTSGDPGAAPLGQRFQPANSADVTNQTVLSLPCSLWWGMDESCVAKMNMIQMQYALDVSNAAVKAYAAVLEALNAG